MTPEMNILINDIFINGHVIERVMIGRDDSEVRVIYRVKDANIYAVRALIEGNEDTREYYDTITRPTCAEMVLICENDIAACYDD
jgi:hypothetical protein